MEIRWRTGVRIEMVGSLCINHNTPPNSFLPGMSPSLPCPLCLHSHQTAIRMVKMKAMMKMSYEGCSLSIFSPAAMLRETQVLTGEGFIPESEMSRDGGKWHDVKGDEKHWLRGSKEWAERERAKQKQMDRYQWGIWSCPFLHLKKGTFQSSLCRNAVVKLASFLLVLTG